MARSKRSKKHLVWIDCEMTGLDPEKNVLLEIATIITDYELEIVARGPVLPIRQREAKLKLMDAWNRRTHGESGLLERMRAEGVSVEEAERQTLAFVKRYCYAHTAPLCGNSIGQDKRFLVKYMPALHDFLHYKIVDVSSIKVLVTEWYDGKIVPPKKQELHRALADIEESIEELKFYRRKVFVKPRN
ncbi:MAG: oligoribonuclease [Acidobacteriota bacterium]